MERIEDLQTQIMQELLSYSDKIIYGTEVLIAELREGRLPDTEEIFNLVIQGINWEIEVFNSCEPMINKDSTFVDKTKMSEAVGRLGRVLSEKDDIKIAACLEAFFLPFLKSMQTAAGQAA